MTRPKPSIRSTAGMSRSSAIESITWKLKPTPGVVPSDDYPPSLRKFEEVTRLLSLIQLRDFGAGHQFLAEENPKRVVELVESIRERAPVAGQSRRGRVIA